MRIELHTSAGLITLELEAEKAPLSTANFASYVTAGHYDGLVFHRVIPNFMVQGGGFDTKGVQRKANATIKNEWKNGLSNRKYTVAMARLGNQPDSGSCQFFINVADNDFLDQPRDGAGYAVFGKIVGGIDIVDAIAGMPTSIKNGMQDWPRQDVVINKAVIAVKPG